MKTPMRNLKRMGLLTVPGPTRKKVSVQWMRKHRGPVLKDWFSLELIFLLPHCLEAKEKIVSIVSAAHLSAALFRVFPRTISAVLRTAWDMIAHDEGPQETVEAFDQCLRNFIGSHSTEEDCHDLIAQLCAPRKPREILVQSFCCRLREVNGCVNWLPGDEPSLAQDQMKQAFFDSMPSAWRDQSDEAGQSNSHMTLAQALWHFRKQENLAIRKQAENNRQQRDSSKRFICKTIPKSTPFRKEEHGPRDTTKSSTSSSSKKPFVSKRKISLTQILAPLMTMNTHGVLVTPIIAANAIKSDVAETTKATKNQQPKLATITRSNRLPRRTIQKTMSRWTNHPPMDPFSMRRT